MNYSSEDIREELFRLADKDYQKFSSALLPDINNIIGVRLPELHKIAKQISKGDLRDFIENCKNEYFEEIMLHGMIIGYAKGGTEEKLKYVEEFVPIIDNWSVCDSFCNGLKFTKDNMKQVWNFIYPYLESSKEFEVRFGVVMILNYYINQEYIEKVLETLDRIKHQGYYSKMAVAWAVSMCYVKFPDITMGYLRNNNLDDFTYNKSLQKIIESLRVDKEEKLIIKKMKR